MKKVLILVLAISLLPLLGCSPISVRTDYAREIDFSQYQTFKWMPYPKNKKGKVPRNSFLDQRIRRAVERELEAKGYQIKKNGPADAMLAYHVGVRNRVDIDHYGYGYRYWGPRTYVRHYKEGSIIIDLVDPAEKQLIWRGVASGAVGGQSEDPEKINKAVAKVLEQYPPRS